MELSLSDQGADRGADLFLAISPGLSNLGLNLFPEVLVKELGDLFERLLGFGTGDLRRWGAQVVDG
jgi:hypothetical protein